MCLDVYGRKIFKSWLCSIEQDQDRGKDVRTFSFKDYPFDSDGTFSPSFHGQAASGVDFVLADTEEHDYIRLTAL